MFLIRERTCNTYKPKEHNKVEKASVEEVHLKVDARRPHHGTLQHLPWEAHLNI